VYMVFAETKYVANTVIAVKMNLFDFIQLLVMDLSAKLII
jgi:hypothetical protein